METGAIDAPIDAAALQNDKDVHSAPDPVFDAEALELPANDDADAADTAAEGAVGEEVSMADIFGDFGGDDDVADIAGGAAASDGADATIFAPPRIPGAVQDLWLPELPRAPMPDRVNTVRLPKIVSVAMQAYDPATYSEEAETAALRAADKAMAIDAMVRYRFRRDAAGRIVTDELGVPQRESNTRIVEWSDGSLTLHVGAEVLALVQQRTGTDHTTHTTLFAAAEAAAVDPSAAAAAAPSAAGHKRPRAETVLEAQASVSHRLLVRALDGASSALADRGVIAARVAAGGKAVAVASAGGEGAGRLRKSVGGRTVDISLEGEGDPEAAAGRRIRAEEEAARALEAQRRRTDAAAGGGESGAARSRGAAGGDGGRGSSSGVSLAAIKARARQAADSDASGSDES